MRCDDKLLGKFTVKAERFEVRFIDWKEEKGKFARLDVQKVIKFYISVGVPNFEVRLLPNKK